MTKDIDRISHELWSAAQLTPGEGIEDGVRRIAEILKDQPTKPTAWAIKSRKPHQDPWVGIYHNQDDAEQNAGVLEAISDEQFDVVPMIESPLGSAYAEQVPAGEVPDGELAEAMSLIEQLDKLLAGVAVALKGEELPLRRHSYHDLPEVARLLRLERDLLRVQVEEVPAALSQQAAQEPIGYLYDWTHSSALGKPDEHFTSFTTDKARAERDRNPRPVYAAAPSAGRATEGGKP